MILVDTSIWIDHLQRSDSILLDRLARHQVLTHPLVAGELAIGNLRERSIFLGRLANLPKANIAAHDEVLHFIERQALFGTGIGFIDVSLLASTMLTPGASIWTRDKRLRAAAVALSLDAKPLY